MNAPLHKRWAVPSAPRHNAAARAYVKDIDHALQELATARDEMARIPDGIHRYQRVAALAEPLARLRLVRRFIEDVIEAYE